MLRLGAFLFGLLYASGVAAQAPGHAPWSKPDAIIIPEPYGGNQFEFAKAFTDPKLKAILLKAGQGATVDDKVLSRAGEAQHRSIPFGLYFWGVSAKPWRSTTKTKGKTVLVQHRGVPVRDQVREYLQIAQQTGPGLMALDLEGVNDGKTSLGLISLPEAEMFVALLRKCIGRDPFLYVNQSTMKAVAAAYGAQSSFANTPLWLAGRSISFTPNRLWKDYVLWQFGAEWDCDPYRPKSQRDRVDYATCDLHASYPIKGSHYDLDVDLFRGDADRLRILFGAPLRPDPACAAT